MKHTSFKWGTLSLLLFVSAGLAAACSNSDSSGEESEDSDSDVVTLEYWRSSETGRPSYEVFMEVVEKFDEEHDDINLDINTTPHDDYKTRLNTQAAGGELPDIFQVWPGAELEPLVEGDTILPIDDITGHWLDSGLLAKGSFDEFTINENVYAVPLNSNPTHFIYYDKDILAEAGYDSFPETYDEFLTLIDDLKAEGTTPIALGNSPGWVLQSVYLSTIADRYTGSDFLEQVQNGEASFTDPEFVDGLGVINDLVEKEAFNEDLNTIDNSQMLDYFLRGNSAMVMDGNWAVSELVENKPDDKNIGVTSIPVGDSNSISTTMGTAMAINSDISEEKEEAAKTFLKEVYNEELFQKMQGVGTSVPTNIEAPTEDLDPLMLEMLEVAKEAEPVPVYDATLDPGLIDTIENELQSITLNEVEPKDAAENIQNEIE